MVAVKVDFPSGRPVGELKLIVKLNNQESELRIGINVDVQWSGNM